MAYVPQDFQSGDVLMASQLNEMDAQISRNEAAAANRDFIANDYDPTATYKKGDMVIYAGTVQVATVDIPVAEAFAPSHWKLTTMDEMLKDSLATKATIDGYYEEMTVGDAEQLVATQYVEDSTPYSYRTTGGTSDVGNREYLDKIVGGTVGWNQLAKNSNAPSSRANLTIAGFEDGFTVTGTASENTTATGWFGFANPSPMAQNHVCMSVFELVRGTVSNLSSVQISLSGTSEGTHDLNSLKVFRTTASPISSWLGIANGTVFTDAKLRVQLFDLTAMFGPTIADYIYNLEQATPGAGVAWFRKYFPKDYYPYNAGELISVKPVSHDMVGFNLWDEEWELGSYYSDGRDYPSTARIRTKHFNPIIPGATYYANTPYVIDIYFFDSNKNHIAPYIQKANVEFTAPAEARYIKFCTDASYGTTYKNDICINLSWSGTHDGEYEPYEKHSYPFDPNVELRGIAGIDANGGLVYDGDEYLPDGTVTRKYGIVNLGTLTWAAYGSYADMDRYVTSGIDATIANETRNAICSKYPWQFKANGFAVGAGTGKLSVLTNKGQYSDVATFKAAMDGVYLVYELATPTTETAEPYSEVQICNDWGTEEFVSNSIMPVGHETRYPANLRDKLQHLPSLAEDDGEYIVKQTGSQMKLAQFKDGTYPDMHVGTADQLLSKKYVEDQVPYGIRQSGGGLAIGDHAEDMIVGGTVVWNQLIDKSKFVATGTIDGYSYTNNGDGSFTLELTASPSATQGLSITPNSGAYYFKVPSGHKFIILDSNPQPNGIEYRNGYNGNYIGWNKINTQAESGGRVLLNVGLTPTAVAGTYKFRPQIFDLTQMLGSTVADAVYAMEQATPGAGAAWFNKLFPKDYYEYNAGELKSVEAINSHEMVGFNLLPSAPVHLNNTPLAFDEAKAVRVFSGQTYEFCFDSIGSATTWRKCIRMWDLNKNLVIREANSNPELNDDFEPAAGAYYNINNNCYLEGGNGSIKTMTITFKRDVYVMFAFALGDTTASMEMTKACFHLVGNGARNGEYEPYHKSSYPLDSSLTLRGIPKLDTNNKLYYDGDTYAGDGTVTRKYGIVDLGTATWSYNSTNGIFYSGDISHFVKAIRLSETANAICPKYETVAGTGYNGDKDKSISIGYMYRANDINIKDSAYTDAAAFKTAMSGVMLVYELEEPTTEQAEPYQSVQQVDPYGTEEYTHSGDADVYIPVGHVTKYPTDLRSKIENAPDAPGTDGDYIVRKTSSGASYIPLSQVKELPDAPSTDGTYRLTVTVTNGTPAYSWVSA